MSTLVVETYRKIHIQNVYFPPSLRLTTSLLLTTLKLNINDNLIIGDFNAWHPLWGSKLANIRGNIIEQFVISNDLFTLNTGAPTHFSTHSSFSSVDLSICSSNLLHQLHWNVIDDLHGSDHFPILIFPIQASNNQPTKTIAKFKTQDADWSLFSTLLDKNIDHRPKSLNINKEAASLTKSILSAANESIPQTSGFKPKRSVFWWNKELQKLRNSKMKLWELVKVSPNAQNILNYRRAMASFRNKVKSAKSASFKSFTANINPNMNTSALWHTVRAFTKKSSLSNNICSIKKIDSSLSTDPLVIANTMAQHYSNISADLNYTQEFLNLKDAAVREIYVPSSISKSAKEIEKPFSLVEILLALSKTKETSPGYDRITYQMIKSSSLDFKYRLLDLFNLIFSKGVIPLQWKKSIIICVPKHKKPLTLPESYRPISLISCLSKTLEKMVAKRLMWFLIENHHLDIKQNGFKRNCSTIDSLIHIHYYLVKQISKHSHCSILSIDFEKAFDKIGIHCILNQLKEWNLGKNIYSYVKSFLTNRTLQVSSNSCLSSAKRLVNGIPQGSPLSVAIFLIAFEKINTLLNNIPRITHSLYADDLIILIKPNSSNNLQSTLNTITDKLKPWTLISGASISHSKCKHLHVCRKISCNIQQLTLDNSLLESVKILGIVFNKRLNWKSQIKHLTSDLAIRLNIIRYICSLKGEAHFNSSIHILRAIFLAKIDYGLVLFGSSPKSILSPTKKYYHQALRSITLAFRTTNIRNLLLETGLPTIEERYKSLLGNALTKFFLHKQLNADICNFNKQKRKPRLCTVISEVSKLAKEIPITFHRINSHRLSQPSWIELNDRFLNSSPDFNKKNSANNTLKEQHLREIFLWEKNGWSIWYCDGSKTQHTNSFAVVTHSKKVLVKGILPPFTSIFTSELTAIEEAMKAKPPHSKVILCSDSLSAINALQSHNIIDPLILRVRDTLIKTKNFKLLYTPSHVDISGNDFADLSAREANHSPMVTYFNFTKKDVKNYVKNDIRTKISDEFSAVSSQHHYKIINPDALKATYPNTIKKHDQKIITRLRLGHSKLTHEFLLSNQPPPLCPKCNDALDMKHLLLCYNNQCENVSLLEAIQSFDFPSIKKHIPETLLFQI